MAVSFHRRECFETTVEHLRPLEKLAVTGYTTDGKKGLVLAYKTLFPEAMGQRCLVHIQMRVGTLLTANPKLLAGQELSELVKQLFTVKTTDKANLWWEAFTIWQYRHQITLNQRSKYGKHWWYTHRNLRYAWKHVVNAADQLFVFISYPNSVSHTNHLEGLFGQRKPALYRHRGLSRRKVANALMWTFYLLSKR